MLRTIPWTERTIVILLLVASVSLNVLLSWHVQRLSNARFPPPYLAAGATFPDLLVKQVNGEAVKLVFTKQQRPSLVYVVTASCPTCDDNWVGLRAVMEATKHKYRTLVLLSSANADSQALSSATAAMAGLGEVYSIEPAQVEGLRLVGAPSTVVVDSEGLVQRFWEGSFGGTVLLGMKGHFGIDFPDVVTAASKQ